MFKNFLLCSALAVIAFLIISPAVHAQVPPTNPINLVATSIDSGTGFKLTWTPVTMPPGGLATVSYYLVRRLDHNPDPPMNVDSVNFVILGDTVRTSLSSYEYKDHPPKAKNGGYWYMVRATLSNGVSMPSNMIYESFGQPSTAGPIVLTGEYVVPNVAKLAWTPPTGVTILKYYVLRVPMLKPDSVDRSKTIVLDSTKGTTYRDSVANPGMGGFGYQVRALIGNGSTVESNGIFVNFNPPLPTTFALSIGMLEAGKGFKLTWTPPLNVKVDSFTVYRAASNMPSAGVSPQPAAFSFIGKVLGGTSFSDSMVAPGAYYYFLKAFVNSQPIPSNVVFGNLQPIQFQLAATPTDGRKSKLAWINPPPGTTKYFIYRYQVSSTAVNFDTLATRFALMDSVPAPVGEYKDTSLNAPSTGASYAYYVMARDGGKNPRTNFAFVYIAPSTPATTFRLNASYVDSSKLSFLSWAAPVNVPGPKYYIYRYSLVDPSAPYDPDHTVLIDSTNGTTYVDSMKLTIPSGARALAYAVVAKPSSGSLVTSNVAVVTIAPAVKLEAIKLSAGFISPGKRGLGWVSPVGVLFDYYIIYRMPVASENTGTIDVTAMSVLDTTKQAQYTDSLLKTHADSISTGFAYQVRGKSGNSIYVSNVAYVVIQDRITLSGYTDEDASIKLAWSKPYNLVPVYYLIYRTRLDSASKFDVNVANWTRIDSVTAMEYRDRPTALGNAKDRGFVYQISAFDASKASLRSNFTLVYWKVPPPQPFTLQGREDNGKVTLGWNQPGGFSSPKYVIYRAILAANSSNLDPNAKFDSLGTTTDKSFVDTPPFGVGTGKSNSFAYYVTALQTGATTQRTNSILVFIYRVSLGLDKLYFASDPVKFGQVGVLYSYLPRGISSDSTAKLSWALLNSPGGMTIDTSSGLVQWTPSAKGWFKVNIVLTSSKGSKAVQEFYIVVAGGRGFVQGLVTDTLGSPVTPVLIRLLKRDKDNSFEYSTITDSLGIYRFDIVDVGTYTVFAMPLRRDFVPQWYFEKKTPDQANSITVADSATVVVNFKLRSRDILLSKFNLTGYVQDSLGKPIVGATVIFAKAGFFLNSAKNLGATEQQSENYKDLFNYVKDAVGLNSNSLEVFRTVTDTAGRYSLKVVQDAYMGVSFSPGYRKTFYNQKTDLLSANLMRLTKDTTNINFTLRNVQPVALGSISGSVGDSAKGTAVVARMIAFRDKRDNQPADGYFADTDTSGNYTIGDLPPGDYYVLALPLGSYAPGFYSVTGITTSWKRGTKVTVNGSGVSGIDIFVRPFNRTVVGFTYVGGSVSTVTGTGGTLAKRLAATGVNGTLVYATASDGTIAGYGVTDETGAFTIPGLAPQTFSITTDKIGYDAPASSQTVSPSYDANGNPLPISNANFSINPSSTTGVDDASATMPTVYELRQNYPNPFNPSTRISFSVPVQEKASLVIYNILGQKVATLFEGTVEAGVHAMTWNGTNDAGRSVASGVYFYQIRTGNFFATKKMVLLK
jgi:hypothetical protein